MDKLKLILAAVAPTIATMLSGPMAGAAVAELSKRVLGYTSEAQPELAHAVAQAVLTPDKLAEIKKLDAEMQQRVAQAGLDLERMAAEDRANARSRDIEVRRMDGGKNDRANWMIVGDVAGLVGCMSILIFFRKEIPGEVAGILSTIAAGFVLCLRDAHTFEFGSSRGSKEKSELIAKIAKGE